MDEKRRGIIAFLLVLLIVISSCTPNDQKQIENVIKELAGKAEKDLNSQADQAAKTAQAKFATLAAAAQATVTSVFGELLAQEEKPNVFGTIIARTQSAAPFIPPTIGYMGLHYKEAYTGTQILHQGVDIWASKVKNNDGNRGNPVYAVLGGKLGRTGSGVEICHPSIDTFAYKNLPFTLVCSYYAHLTDLPAKFANLPKDTCPNNLAKVETGELLGYMDNKDMVSNNGIVHLHFSVVKQNPQNGCWTNELNIGNTLDPFVYLGIKTSDYPWWAKFP